MSSVIVAWTGHRPDVFEDQHAALTAVTQLALQLRPSARRFLVGGQRGVDTWAALAAIALRVPFALILPQVPELFAADWPAEDRATLDRIVAWASTVEVAHGYSARNRRLARGADLLVAVWTGTRGGGTEETIAFARGAGVPVRQVMLGRAAGAAFLRGRGI